MRSILAGEKGCPNCGHLKDFVLDLPNTAFSDLYLNRVMSVPVRNHHHSPAW